MRSLDARELEERIERKMRKACRWQGTEFNEFEILDEGNPHRAKVEELKTELILIFSNMII